MRTRSGGSGGGVTTTTTTTDTVKGKEKRKLRSWNDVPVFLQHNKYKTSGYRVNYSILQCFTSIFQWHNETFEIWTHLLGTAFFLLMLIPTLNSLPTSSDIIVLSIFFVCTIIQMVNSTVFHIFNCKSPAWYSWMVRLDYSGISIMIVGCYVPPLFYGYTCYPNLGLFYISCFIALGTIGIIIGFLPIFSAPKYIFIRIGFYLLVGWLSFIPIAHLVYLMGIELVWLGAKGLLIMGILCSLGAVCYATRFPEMCFPGAFNVSLFSSHVIWHYFTMAAAGLHLWNCLYVHSLAKTTACPSAPAIV